MILLNKYLKKITIFLKVRLDKKVIVKSVVKRYISGDDF